ncbi:hypothetical protein [Neisseria lactamica]|uniref:hypothetical protein n=1 Tax=Neisseria lactamica TaxID=486 RepID=UPI000E57CD8D|nr:hypothetical protein [Neisseria lactamica]
MKKMLFLFGILLSANVLASDYLCSYQARISNDDKFNSSGNYIATQYSRNVVAAIIRQERANFHKFGVRDDEDQGDCVFASKENRARLERWLASGQISANTIRRIVDGTPLIYVDVYRNRVSVRTL